MNRIPAEQDVQVVRLEQLPLASLQPLLVESRSEGFGMLDELVQGFREGSNRFDRPGEALFGVFAGPELVAVGGLNRDPYLPPELQAGRVRRVYVLSGWRRRGVGRLLVEQIVAAARPHFRLLTLRTNTVEAVRFYCALGFKTEPQVEGATHHLVLPGAQELRLSGSR